MKNLKLLSAKTNYYLVVKKLFIFMAVMAAMSFNNNVLAQEEELLPGILNNKTQGQVQNHEQSSKQMQTVSTTQTVPYNCPVLYSGTPNYITTIHNAVELYQTLTYLYLAWQYNMPAGQSDYLNPSNGCAPLTDPGFAHTFDCDPTDEIVLTIVDDIYLGDLNDPSIFPFEVPPGVTIEGTFNIAATTKFGSQSLGSRIYFPYLYENGGENTMLNPGDYHYDKNEDQAAVFKLNDGCRITQICIVGPETDYHDARWIKREDKCNPGSYIEAREGLSSGIIVWGNKCRVDHCEIYGFPLFGTLVRDMVKLGLPGQPEAIATTSPCYNDVGGAAPNPYGEFEFDHNYIHHCIGNGFAYGIYVSAGGGIPNPCSGPPQTCRYSTTPSNQFFNFIRPDEEAHIHDNIFWANTTDIDGSSARLSMNIENNSFGERNTNNNIDFHNANGDPNNQPLTVCNWYYVHGLTRDNNTPDFQSIGGQSIIINHNAFYKYVNNMELQYPNINDCYGSTFPLTNGNPYPFKPAVININNNYFNTRAAIVNGQIMGGSDALEWGQLLNLWCDGQSNKIRFAHHGGEYQFYDFRFLLDNALQIDESASLPVNHCQTHTDYDNLWFDPNSLTPRAVMALSSSSSGPFQNSPVKIPQGGTIYFKNSLCTDKSGHNPPTNQMLYIMNFHDQFNDLNSELRYNTNALFLPHAHTFNNMGITDVTMMTVDLTNAPPSTGNPNVPNNDWRASNLARQRVTVTPPAGNTDVWLTFWIKDTFRERQLTKYGPNNNGVDDTRNAAPCSRTSYDFVKFAEFRDLRSGFNQFVTVWSEEIGCDDGWEYIKVNLTNVINGYWPQWSGWGQLRFGVRSTSSAVNAEDVRGVNVYVDDVYVNSMNTDPAYLGQNAVANGGMENWKPFGGSATSDEDPHAQFNASGQHWRTDVWPPEYNPTNINPLVNFHCPNLPQYGDSKSPVLTKEEVHSGSFSYGFHINPMALADQWGNNIYAGQTFYYDYYVHDYGNITSDEFNVYGTPPPIINPTSISFFVNPVPAKSNDRISLKCDENNEEKIISVISLEGTLIISDKFKGGNYAFKHQLAPGIYFVHLTETDKSSVKKIVITQ
jgi:hypothetical protein